MQSSLERIGKREREREERVLVRVLPPRVGPGGN
jgi:hypothetical protein